MRHKIVLILFGCTAFVAVTILITVLQAIVNGFLPNNRPDPPGQMMERPIDKARREVKQKPETKPTQTQTEPKPQTTTESQTENPEPEPETQTQSQPEPSVIESPPRAPAPPSRGPGNLGAPPPPSTGPGNLQGGSYGGSSYAPTGPGNLN